MRHASKPLVTISFHALMSNQSTNLCLIRRPCWCSIADYRRFLLEESEVQRGETLARLLLLNTTSEDVIGMWLRAYLELTPWSDRTRICHALRWPSTSYVCLPYISGINSLTWAALGCCSGSYAMHCCTTCQSRSEEILLGRRWVTPWLWCLEE